MNRWSWLAVVAMAVALPALAQERDRWRDWERERGRDFREVPVMIEKRRVMWMLTRIDNHLSEIIGKARPPDRRMLKDLRDELNDVRDMLNAAQALPPGTAYVSGQPVPPGPPQQLPPQAPPPGYQTNPQQPGYWGGTAQPPQQPPPPGYQQPPPPGQPAVSPMADPAFRNLLGAMSRESFANDRLRVLDQAAPANWFMVAQVQQVLAQFDFPADRLKAVRILRPRVLDTNNFFQLYGAFEFPRDKDELKRILGQ